MCKLGDIIVVKEFKGEDNVSIMNNTNKVRLPKGFFNKERKTMPLKESLKDVIPVEWVKKGKNTVLNSKEKTSYN